MARSGIFKLNSSDISPGAQIVIILLWGTATVLYFLKVNPYPVGLTAAGGLLGLVGGFFQFASFKQVKQSFLREKEPFEPRTALKETFWGKRYTWFIWGSHFLLALLALGFTAPPYYGLLSGIFALMLVRESITLVATLKLIKLVDENRRNG